MEPDYWQQLETNSHLAEINAQLRQQNEALRQAKEEKDRLHFCREMVFSIKKGLEEVYPLISSQPAYSYYQASFYLTNLLEYDISASSFPDFTDKEYILKVLTIGNGIKRDSSSSLSPEQVQNIDYLVRLEYVLPHYARIVNWHEIHNLLPSFDLPINRGTIILMVILSISFLTWPILFIIAYFKWKKTSVMPGVKRLASEVGGWATDKITRADCKIIIAKEEKAIQLLGFTLETAFDKYFAKIKQVKEQIFELVDQLELPSNLN